MNYRFVCCSLCLAIAGLSITGCGGKPGPNLKWANVTGKVTQDGKPLVGVTVVFYPQQKAPQSSSITNDDGDFVLMSSDNKKGAVVGDHVVTVTCPQPVSMSSSSRTNTPPKSLPPCKVPSTVQTPDGSPLKVTVEEKGGPIEIKVPKS